MSSLNNIHEINKRILKKPIKPRSESDVLGPYNKYRDEYLKVYNERKHKFLQIVKNYKDYNKQLLTSSSKSDDYDITEEFRKELQITGAIDEDYFKEFCDNSSATFMRKRIENRINYQRDYQPEFCTLEPWLKRFIILARFIRVARNIIIRNRLLKNLAILKELTEKDLEKFEKETKYHNVTYKELFEKFI